MLGRLVDAVRLLTTFVDRARLFDMDNSTTPEPGTLVLVETKPFVDSDKIRLDEVGIISTDSVLWTVTRNGRGRYCIPVSTIRAWVKA